jgi:phosphatidylglycerophosphate synthase
MIDWCDGIHARNIKKCSVLGSFLDHSLDAVSIPLTVALMQRGFETYETEGQTYSFASNISLLALISTELGLFMSIYGSFMKNEFVPNELAELLFGWVSPALFAYVGVTGFNSCGSAGPYIALAIFFGGFKEAGVVVYQTLTKKDFTRKSLTDIYLWLVFNVVVGMSWLLRYQMHHQFTLSNLSPLLASLDYLRDFDGVLFIFIHIYVNGVLVNHVLMSSYTKSMVAVHPSLSLGWKILVIAPYILYIFSPPLGFALASVLWLVNFCLHSFAMDAAEQICNRARAE